MATAPAFPAEHRIGDLQVLRGVSIFFVLLQHTCLTSHLAANLPNPVDLPFLLGVDLFFVISGFVIITALARDRFEPVSFFVKRVFRLTPALLTLAVAAAVLNGVLTRMEMPDGARKALQADWPQFFRATGAVLGGYYTLQWSSAYSYGAMWSLSVEDQFYAALGGLGLVVALVTRRHAPRVLPWLVCGLAAGFYLYVQYLRLNILAGGRPAGPRWNYFVIFRFDLLALGVVLAFFNLRFGDRVARFFADRGPFLSPILLLVPLGLTAVCGTPHGPNKFWSGLALPFAGICFGLLVLAAAHERATPATRGWAHRFWRYLGDRSYTLYLYNFFTLLAAWAVLQRLAPTWAFTSGVRFGFLQMAVAVPLLLAVVELVHRGVERPLTALGRRLARRVRVIPADPAPTPAPAASPAAAPTSRAA